MHLSQYEQKYGLIALQTEAAVYALRHAEGHFGHLSDICQLSVRYLSDMAGL